MLTKLAFAAAALIFTTVGFSQDLPKKKDGYKRKEFNLPSMDQPIVIMDSALIRNQQLREAYLQRLLAMRQGQYSHRTLNGKVMVLPRDNMPCLVPDKDKSVAMPTWTPKQMPENMPNGIKPHKIIPDKKE